LARSSYDNLGVWREHAETSPVMVESNHFLPEETAEETCLAPHDFSPANWLEPEVTMSCADEIR
jgi:hypothetical protein